jgi:hypothetical protein
MAPVATRVNLKLANRRALRQYGVFWRAVQAVDQAIADAEKLGSEAEDISKQEGQPRTVPSAEELRAAAKKAGRGIEIMAKASKKWEAELVSREWRKR